jgi:hypothetical protein
MSSVRPFVYPPAKIRSIYRQILTLLRNTSRHKVNEPGAIRSLPAHKYHYTDEYLQLSNTIHRDAALTDEADIAVSIKQLLDSLSILKLNHRKYLHRSEDACNAMNTDNSRVYHSNEGNIDAPSQQQTDDSTSSASRSWYVNEYGELVSGHSPSRHASVRKQRAQYNVTSEEVRRHHGIMERFNFGGSYWEGKRNERNMNDLLE